MSAPDAAFDRLLAEGEAPIHGWEFTWLDGRATEERPPWRYAEQVSTRMATADAGLDIQTGGGEVLASIERPPPVLVATESWPPNVEIARRRLRPLGGDVVGVGDTDTLPFGDDTFDLVVSRHPTTVIWSEIARVLAPGGTYFSQQVGSASAHEVSEAMLGPFQPSTDRDPQRAAAHAEAVGLEVIELQDCTLLMEFFDVAAFVVFLRIVIWIVPDFSVDRFRSQLRTVHDTIRRDGVFLAHSTRFLIEARKPG